MDPKENRPKKKIVTWGTRAELLEGEQHLIVERPLPLISLVTINRPEIKNMMSHRTRAQLFNQLQVNDEDPDIRITVIRGAGGNFCAGNDFDTNRDEVLPFFEPEIDGQTSRHILNGWFMLNDLAKPVVAMVEGEAIGGGLELAAACDVCVCANDAILGYSPVRGQGLADYQILPWLCGMRNAMELVLTNKQMTGIEAVQKGFATESVPAEELEEKTFSLATRIAKIPSDLLAFNKKSVHRAFEAQGMRTNLRNAVDLEALMFKAPGAKMLTARRGPAQQQRPGAGVPQRVAPPRPMPVPPPQQAVAVQAVSAKSDATKKTTPQIAAKAEAKVEPKKVATPAATKAAVPSVTPIKARGPARPSPATKEQEDSAEDVDVNPTETIKAPAPSKGPVTAPSRAAAPATAAKVQAPKEQVKASVPATPIKSTSAKQATAPATPAAKVASPVAPKTTPSLAAKSPQNATTTVKAATPTASKAKEDDDNRSVHVHLHEAVHIHIGGSRTPSKL